MIFNKEKASILFSVQTKRTLFLPQIEESWLLRGEAPAPQVIAHCSERQNLLDRGGGPCSACPSLCRICIGEPKRLLLGDSLMRVEVFSDNHKITHCDS